MYLIIEIIALKFLGTGKVIYIFAWSIKVITMILIKITANSFNFIEDRSSSCIFSCCFSILYYDLTALAVIEHFPYLLIL